MDWIQRFNTVMDYIEDNLDGEVKLEEAARLACSSPYHFTRMFSYITGAPLGEYLRRRRMSMAALELQQSEVKVLDLALKYGYDSPTAFNRAFQSVHGMAPSAARQAGAVLKSYPRIVFHIALKGDVEMNYRIEQAGPFRVVGRKHSFKLDVEQNFAEVPKFWQQVGRDGDIPKIAMLSDSAPHGLLGLSVGDYANPTIGAEFDYIIGAATSAPVPEGMAEATVPAATWAIFSGDGAMPDAMQSLQKRIVSEWLPTSGYEMGDAPDVEVYLEPMRPDGTQPFEVWMPVEKVEK